MNNYLLNIGLADKDDPTIIMGKEHAIDIIVNALNIHIGGGTIDPEPKIGIWQGNKEPSIACYAIAGIEQIKALVEDLKIILNQNAIAVTNIGISDFM